MRYSLLSRFQGGLLGSIIAESYAKQKQFQLGTEQLSTASKIGNDTLAHLIKTRGQWEPENWLSGISSIDQEKNRFDSNDLAVATLPLNLFFHDSPLIWQQKLLTLIAPELDFDSQGAILLWSKAISLLLSEKLAPSDLISQLLVQLDPKATKLKGQLEQIQAFLETRSSLDRVIAQLSHSQYPQGAITSALYCFLATPEDFRLCVNRAQLVETSIPLTANLTGAMAGVYNSSLAIPIQWRVASASLTTEWTICKQAEQLFSLWSGVYQPRDTDDLLMQAAVAAPQVIQKRASLPIKK